MRKWASHNNVSCSVDLKIIEEDVVINGRMLMRGNIGSSIGVLSVNPSFVKCEAVNVCCYNTNNHSPQVSSGSVSLSCSLLSLRMVEGIMI